MLLEHMKDADLARMMKANNIHLIETALEPMVPIRPRTAMNVAMGCVFGLVLGLGLGWLRNSLDNSIKNPEQVEKDLGITFVGLLPAVEEEGDGRQRRRQVVRPGLKPGAIPELIVHDSPHSGIAEAARSIRTNLMFTNPDRPYRKFARHQRCARRGKDHGGCSIAVARRPERQRVCVIDCDLRRPRLHRIFDRAATAASPTCWWARRPSPTWPARPRWAICGAFPRSIPPNPADLLHSERFKKFLEDAGEEFDRIVIDSPPLVAVTDSAIISTIVDGTVFVLRAFSTTRTLGRQACARWQTSMLGGRRGAECRGPEPARILLLSILLLQTRRLQFTSDSDDNAPPSTRDAASV